jgi:hypothetical protein
LWEDGEGGAGVREFSLPFSGMEEEEGGMKYIRSMRRK